MSANADDIFYAPQAMEEVAAPGNHESSSDADLLRGMRAAKSRGRLTKIRIPGELKKEGRVVFFSISSPEGDRFEMTCLTDLGKGRVKRDIIYSGGSLQQASERISEVVREKEASGYKATRGKEPVSSRNEIVGAILDYL